MDLVLNIISANERLLVGEIIILVIVVFRVGSSFISRTRLNKHLPLGTPRTYGLAGGAVCPHCHRPFPFGIALLKFGIGTKLARCEFCGCWSFVRRRSLEELRAAEKAELAEAQLDQSRSGTDMPNGTIRLIVINSEEKANWLMNIAYKAYSPRHDRRIDFINASRISDFAKYWDMSKYRRIQVNETSTVSDVIEQARQCYSDYDKDFLEADDVNMYNRFALWLFLLIGIYTKRDSKYGEEISYHLYYPALGSQELNRSTKISELRLTNDDLIVIEKKINSMGPAILTGVSGFQEFQDMVWGSEDPNDPMLLATLLYTDEDADLAKYVREHFDEIHQISGPRVITYVLEYPLTKLTLLEEIVQVIVGPTWSSYLRPKPKDKTFAAPLFWKERLDMLTYHAWALLGWTQSKPLNKTAAYEIARKLGIYPDQLPCLAVFDRTSQAEKIVFPVSGDYATFFRSTFSNIQRALDLGPGPDIENKMKLNRERLKLFKKIRESLELVQVDSNTQCGVYKFGEQTVYIKINGNVSGSTIIVGNENKVQSAKKKD